nr:hypothetical protein [Tanacetum cinerariifolium]
MPRTSELSLAAATIIVPQMSTLLKVADLSSMPAVSATKMDKMSTTTKNVEVKSVPRMMKTTNATVRSSKRSLFMHLAKDSCGLKVKVPKQESSIAKHKDSLQPPA